MKYLKNKQILSALIWAATILISSTLTQNAAVSTLLITAAGIHVVMMTQVSTSRTKSCN